MGDVEHLKRLFHTKKAKKQEEKQKEAAKSINKNKTQKNFFFSGELVDVTNFWYNFISLHHNCREHSNIL